jgi:hypothetical protein
MNHYDNRVKFPTKKGGLVLSLYERAVADFLYENNIAYEYERPYRFSTGETVHPDFYLPQYGVYIEVWGMAGDYFYNEGMKWKQERYRKEGVKLIELLPKGGRLNFRFFILVRFKELMGYRLPVKQYVPYFSPAAFPTRRYSKKY